MKITSVMANLAVNSNNNLLAYVNIVFDDVFIIRGIRIVEKSDGSRLMVMPSRPSKAGIAKDVCHPLSQEFRKDLERVVMSKVDNLIKNAKTSAGESANAAEKEIMNAT